MADTWFRCVYNPGVLLKVQPPDRSNNELARARRRKLRRIRLARDVRGAGMTEYIILLGAVALVAIGVFRIFRGSLEAKIEGQSDTLARVDTGEEATVGPREVSTRSHASRPSAFSKDTAEPGSDGATTEDTEVASKSKAGAAKDSRWGVVLLGMGLAAVAVAFLYGSRVKRRSSE